MTGGGFEFGGPVGAVLMLVGLPFTVYAITLICNKEQCSLSLPAITHDTAPVLWSRQAVTLLLVWLGIQLVLYYLPTTPKLGQPLRDGQKLQYPCNGLRAFILSVLGFACAWYVGLPVTDLYQHFVPLITVTTIFSCIGSLLLYIRSFHVPENELAEGGNTGYWVYDLFIGRELNPRIGALLDLKFFFELRPGLIGWVLLDLSFCAQAYEWYGTVPISLILVTLFHTIYVADALWFEECILTTMDIVHDGFGFMLLFGDLVWVPFLYSLQARFLLEHPQEMSGLYVTAVLMLNALGYTIFRKSNSQKNLFRKDPTHESVAHLQTIETQSGRKLLVSGWWGICRHPNYLGDLLMALAWSLPCGLSHLLPYFYPLYFLGLLVHRFERDAVACQVKYGSDWNKYCKLVPYKIIPYVY